jgi:hypothetical protein
MENLQVQGSNDIYYIPAVDFNAENGKLLISGESYLEDTISFYKPIHEWLNRFTKEFQGLLDLGIKLSYFNTASSKCLLQILYILKDYENKGGSVKVTWYYDVSDFDMKEEIEDFEYDSGIKIIHKELDEEN